MKLTKRLRTLLPAGILLGVATCSHAANTLFNPGDLILFFQKPGSNNTVYVGLGSAANDFRGSAAGTTGDSGLTKTNIVNINSTLTSAFGAGWASDASLFAGLAAVRSTSSSTTLVIDQDPARTLYASQARQSVGVIGSASSEPWDFTTSGFSGPATSITALGTPFDNLASDANAAILTVDISTIDDQNPINSGPGGTFLQPSAFSAFPGGVQQQGSAGAFGSFAGVGQTEFALDLYRILPRITAPGQITGSDKIGSFEGTVVVGTDGNVSFLVPEPSSMTLAGLAGLVLVTRRRRSA